jgi:hypothetical protein
VASVGITIGRSSRRNARVTSLSYGAHTRAAQSSVVIPS